MTMSGATEATFKQALPVSINGDAYKKQKTQKLKPLQQERVLQFCAMEDNGQRCVPMSTVCSRYG